MIDRIEAAIRELVIAYQVWLRADMGIVVGTCSVSGTRVKIT